MEKQEIWSILGIKPSKDENEIKEAYRKELVKYNPEDDQAGFRRLREAYEEAIRYANEEEEEKEKDEIDLWIDKAIAIYKNVYDRIDEQKWKDLFKDEVCINLDTCDVAKEKFIVFLMDHYNFPQNVFQLFDEEFNIIGSREMLLEKFPQDFLNYIEYQINHAQFINYDFFEVLSLDESEADIDGFINFFYDMKRLCDEGKCEEFLTRYPDYKNYEVMHPYYKIEKVRALDKTGKKEEAKQLFAEILEKYDDDYIKYMVGSHYYFNEEYDRAMEYFDVLVEKNPEHFGALLYQCKNLLRQKQYTEAKQAVLNLLEKYPRDQELVNLMQEINDGLNIELKKKYDESGKCKDALDYAWCIFQNEKYDETIALLNTLEPKSDEDIYDYNNLYGRCLFARKEYEKTIPYATKWNELIFAAVDDGSEEYKKKERRKGFSCGMLAMCYTETKEYDKAIDFYKKAIEIETNDVNNFSYREAMADCYIRMKEYQNAVDVCDKIIEDDGGYFPAYCHRQEAYYYMNYGQDVIDDYYNAIRIYNKYYKPYYFAASIYYNYRQYDNAMAVIEEAKKNEINSNSLTLVELRTKRMLTESNAERNENIRQLNILLKKTEEENNDLQDKDDILYEICLTYMDNHDYKKALEYINKTIDVADKYGYYWTKGDIYFCDKAYNEALKIYRDISMREKDNPAIHFDLAKTLEKLDEMDEAVEEYKLTLKLDPNHYNANNRIMNIYNNLYNDYNEPKYYNMAISYADRQIEVNPSCYYYVDRGLLLLDGGEHNKAIDDFKKASEYDPNDLYAYNNLGYTYKIIGEIDKAIEALNKAVENMEKTGDNSPYPHRNLAHCYEILGEYEKARQEFEINSKLFPQNKTWQLEMAHELVRLGDYASAIKLYEQIKVKFKSENFNEDIEIAKVYAKMGQKAKVKAKLKFKFNKLFSSKNPTAYELYRSGKIYEFELRNYKLARDYYLEAYKVAGGSVEVLLDVCDNLAVVYKKLNDDGNAKIYAEKELRLIEKKYKSIENYLAFKQYGPLRRGIVGRMYYCLGRNEEAYKLFEEMGQITRCVHCREKVCYEIYLNKGLYYELQQDYKKAYDSYAKAAELAPNDAEGVIGMEVMKGKL